MRRWGNFGGSRSGSSASGPPFAGGQLDGFTIPQVISTGWRYGTDSWAEGGFIRDVVDAVSYR